MTAGLKGISYTSRQLQFSEKELKSPAYLALNARGEVPTLRDGDYVLTESLAIMSYLDAKFPNPPLFGRSAQATGTIWRWICDFIYHVEPLSLQIVDVAFSGEIGAKADEIRSAATGLHAEFARIDSTLVNQPWFGGDELSAADVLSHTDFEFFLRIVGRDMFKTLGLGFDEIDARYPALSAWRKQMTQIPGYDEAYPPHWRSS